MNPDFWRGKRVFMTGHTGFKGGWLTLWLTELGARVHGYALNPPTEPNLFTVAGLESRLQSHTVADVRDADALARAIRDSAPEIVFHLAAQPLVRRSYHAPVETFAVNVMGTVHLLDAIRKASSVRAVINVTSDKCYENHEWPWPYRESDSLGGFDPYSSSKACAELVSQAWRRSYLDDAGIHLATVRAGNVVGGGDWATDRLLPDFLRAIDAGQPLTIRAPNAVRPWQHVLEPISGYLLLAERLFFDGEPFRGAWNFAPDIDDARSVGWIVERMRARVAGATWRQENRSQPHEAGVLRLDASKARIELGWRPRWRLDTALDRVLAWHQAWRSGEDMAAFGLGQIRDYARSPAGI